MTEDFEPAQAALDEHEFERLEALLFSDAVDEEALDAIGAHGFMTALAISPVPVPQEEWLPELLNGEATFSEPAQARQLVDLLNRLKDAVDSILYRGQPLELPCEPSLGDDPDASALRAWASGFMEGVFLREAEWFQNDESAVAELTLPIMVASGLFDDPELTAMADDPALAEAMCVSIPDCLIDLYLLFRAPEEPAKKAPPAGRQRGKGARRGGQKRR